MGKKNHEISVHLHKQKIGVVSARWFENARLHVEVIRMEKIREKERTTLLFHQ